jgi:hypothetical protein
MKNEIKSITKTLEENQTSAKKKNFSNFSIVPRLIHVQYKL